MTDTHAKEAMFARTDLAEAPWAVVKSNDKRRARLEAMRHVLAQFSYLDKDEQLIGRPDPLIVGPVQLDVLPRADVAGHIAPCAAGEGARQLKAALAEAHAGMGG